MSIPNYLSEIYSEELYPTNEAEYDAVMNSAPMFEGYAEWSEEVEQTDVDNLTVDESGEIRHKAQPASLGRIGGIEL
jgi:hypothetical protein